MPRSVFWLLGWGAASQQSLLGCCEPVLAHLRVSDSQGNQAVLSDPGQLKADITQQPGEMDLICLNNKTSPGTGAAAPTINCGLRARGELDVSPAPVKFMELHLHRLGFCKQSPLLCSALCCDFSSNGLEEKALIYSGDAKADPAPGSGHFCAGCSSSEWKLSPVQRLLQSSE